MATTKIQSGAFPADVVTTAAIDDLSVTHAKLHTAMDLSSKTVTLPTLNAKLVVVSPSSAEAINIRGRSADDIGQLKFYENDGTTSLARLDSRTTHFEVGSYNELRLSAGGVGNSHVIIDTSGKVGIGTDNPDAPLVVKSDSGGNTFKLIGRSADNISSLTFANAGNTANNYIQGNSSFIRARADSGFHFRKGGTPVTTDSSGFTIQGLNVGIGVAGPSARLQVAGTQNTPSGTSKGMLLVRADGSSHGLQMGVTGSAPWGSWIQAQDNNISSPYPLTLQPGGGDVGIGTTSPAAKLHIQRAVYGGYNALQLENTNANAGVLNFVDLQMLAGGSTGKVILRMENSSASGATDGELAIHTTSGGTTTERMRIDSSGRVGIGTGANVTTNAHANADDLVIGNTSTRTGMTIVSDPAQNGNIHFSDGTSTGNANIKGQLTYEHSDNSFRFYINSSTEALRLGTSGGTVFNNGQDINQNFIVKASGNASALVIDGNGGNVGIGTSSPTRLFSVSSDTTRTSGFEDITEFLTPSIGAGGSVSLNVGRTNSTKNLGKIAFYYAGAGSDSNRLGFGFFNADNLMVLKANGNVGIGTNNPTSDLHVDGSIVSTNLAQGTGELQIQGYGATGYINMSGAGSLRFRMGSSYTEHMSLAPGGQLLASAAGRYTGLNSNAWVTFGRLYGAQSTPLNIKVIVGHNSSGGYNEFNNDTYAYNIAAGTVVTIGNTTGGYTCQIRKIKRIGGQNGIPGAHYNGGDGGWEYQVARNQAYGMSVGIQVMGATTAWTWTI